MDGVMRSIRESGLLLAVTEYLAMIYGMAELAKEKSKLLIGSKLVEDYSERPLRS